jgi:hypothetical protein
MSHFVPTSRSGRATLSVRVASRALALGLSAMAITTVAGCGDDAPATPTSAAVGPLGALQAEALAKFAPPGGKTVLKQDRAAGGYNAARAIARSTGWKFDGESERADDAQGQRISVTGKRTLSNGRPGTLQITLVSEDKVNPLPKGTYLLKVLIASAG